MAGKRTYWPDRRREVLLPILFRLAIYWNGIERIRNNIRDWLVAYKK
jgi:hypothetical protein